MEQSSAAQSPVLTRGKSYSIDESHLTAAEAGQAVYNVVTSKTPDVDRARTLMRLRPDLEWQHPVTRRTALIEAAGKSHRVLVQLLLDNGASRDARDKDGLSARDLAVKKDLLVMVCLLEGRDMTPSEAGREAAKAVARAGAALWAAIDSGDVDRVRVSLRRLPPMPPKGLSLINVPGNEEGWTPLVKAAHLGHDAIVGALLEAGARADVADRAGRMAVDHARGMGWLAALAKLEGRVMTSGEALWQAVKAGQAETARDLLSARADLEYTAGAHRATPLIVAASRGDATMVEVLMAAGANSMATDGSGRTAHMAWGGRNQRIAAALAPPKSIGERLWDASEAGDEAAVRAILADGGTSEWCAPDGFGHTPLHRAAFRGHEGVARVLLGAGAVLDATCTDGDTALILACWLGHEGTVRLLIDAGADTTTNGRNGRTALDAARLPPYAGAALEQRAGVYARVVALLEAGGRMSVDEADAYENARALWEAAGGGDATRVRTLLAAGADLEHRTSAELTTPLLQAARYGHEEVVSALIGARANTEARDGTAGRTAIDFASYGGFASVLVVLLRAGAFVEGGYPRGATPLIFAARRGHAACVTILAEHGARIEHKATDAQWTALIEAASAGANAAVKALLVAGAYVDGRGGKGETALYEAACAGHADVVTTLLKSGAVNRFDDWGAVPIPDPFAAAMREARRRGHTDVVALLDMHVLTEADFEREYGCSRKAFGQYKAWKQRTLHRMNGGA